MKKLGAVLIVVSLTVALYLIVLVVMPVLTDLISTANATVTSSGGWGNYPGNQGAFLSIPWVLWFVPGTICMIIIVMILRSP